ncbi:response regulator [Candidatus Chloroploca sp. M-50]|uniref:histidine kinase n=1 Tax=Candidatus Chloroploca mongolica TaxID=2528176 RepID=A0ABS4D5U8_9CHLR|nr:response regulator [Candidatus Chloroploca mongolica]MBP1464811.1 response regulator [Candidatus Chloroploca mongolica]
MENGTILAIDDNPQMLSILADLLHPLGHTVVCATNGPDALVVAMANPPDLVLLDVMMPGMDGFEVCRHMRAHPALAHVPVVLVTALDDRESRVEGFEAGADEFVTKPFDYVELRARVTTILRLNRYRTLVEQQRRTATERARFVWAVEHSDDGILLLDESDQVHYANPCARTILGLAPDAPLEHMFLPLATQQYRLTPPEAWDAWPHVPAQDDQSRFLVSPERASSIERWIRVDLLPPAENDATRVLRMRDVTEQMVTQREMWTFHTMLAHKLRTPLVGILGGLNILSGGGATMDRESIVRIAEVALAGARRLRSEIEDILHYLRSPSDVYGLDSIIVSEVSLLLDQVARDLELKHVTIEAPSPESANGRIALTQHSLEVLLREVLENCVKFHPHRAPEVQIKLSLLEPKMLRLEIIDDGPGMSNEQRQRAWYPYYQGERNFTGQVEGMGLGLALVARIVHAVGGRCALANRTDSHGTIVTLTLPLAAS